MAEVCGETRPDNDYRRCGRPAGHAGSHLLMAGPNQVDSIWDANILLINQPVNGVTYFRSFPPSDEDSGPSTTRRKASKK